MTQNQRLWPRFIAPHSGFGKPSGFCNNSARRMSNLYRLADQKARRRIVSFERRELTRMLNLYSMIVAIIGSVMVLLVYHAVTGRRAF